MKIFVRRIYGMTIFLNTSPAQNCGEPGLQVGFSQTYYPVSLPKGPEKVEFIVKFRRSAACAFGSVSIRHARMFWEVAIG